MKRSFIFLTLLSLNTFIFSCSKGDDGGDDNVNQESDFNPQIDVATSTTSQLKSGFEAGDDISLFVWNSEDVEAPTDDDFSTFNLRLIYDGTEWRSDGEISEAELAESIVAGVYPATTEGSTVEQIKSIDVDMENQVLYYRVDMSGLGRSLTPSFSNAQSELAFNIVGDQQSATILNFSATVALTATLNLLSGSLTPNSAESATLEFTQNETTPNLYSSLMIPQTITSFKITLSSNTYEYDGAGITLEAGKSIVQSISLVSSTVDGEIGDIVLGTQFDIADWEEEQGATGDFSYNE